MTRRTKLELEINKPVTIELLYDEPITGESQYGSYSMYAVSADGMEYSFFAPDEVHTELLKLSKGDVAVITKLASQRGNKVVTKYEVEVPNKVKAKSEMVSIGEVIDEILPNINAYEVKKDRYYEILRQSYADALQINTELNGISADTARLCITLFIARSKTI
ncbi:MAG: hypothetical protein H6613_12995 [Ignavibacteriales bacterium]|nr:hypothetical protein [Ignavibacteriales bacterium]